MAGQVALMNGARESVHHGLGNRADCITAYCSPLISYCLSSFVPLCGTHDRVSRQVASGAQVELCLLRLPPGFPAVPHHFNLSPVGSCPSQNRACAINAHGSPDNHSGSDETGVLARVVAATGNAAATA